MAYKTDEEAVAGCFCVLIAGAFLLLGLLLLAAVTFKALHWAFT